MMICTWKGNRGVDEGYSNPSLSLNRSEREREIVTCCKISSKGRRLVTEKLGFRHAL